jgi:zinc transporter ZupT
MKRVMSLMYSIATGVLALAGLLYAFGPVSSVAGEKSANLADGSPWPAVLLSAVVLVAGIAVQHRLVARPGKRPSVQDKSLNTASLTVIVAICSLGLLVSLCAAIYGWDLNPGLPW